MLWDWITREGWIVFDWWLISTVMSLAVLPGLVRLMPGLPDRGYTLARAAGLLMVAFTFWLLAMLGFVNNSAGSMVLAWVIVFTVSLAIYANVKTAFLWRDWWRENRSIVISADLLFIVLLVAFSIFRAFQNGMTATEQPMDLALMSGVQQSATFPPNDPWLAGYSISYYYFGYVMAAMNNTLVGVPATTGYGMHLALLFALTGVTAFGVVVNLIRSRVVVEAVDVPENLPELGTLADGGAPPQQSAVRRPSAGTAIGFGLLGMFFLLMMSNFHMVLVELPYRNRAFDDAYYQFWDAKDRNTLPQSDAIDLLDPEQARLAHWWWFAHARTITERSLELNLEPGDYYQGQQLTESLHVPSQRVNEVIDEFPAFSFVLGDSHPHVMALPFVLLALGLALSVLLSPDAPDAVRIVFYGICLGGLIFLNTWDAPIYLVVLVGAEMTRRVVKAHQLDAVDVGFLATFGVAVGAVMVIAYFPFLASFQSQLGGILPNVLYPTRPQQMLLMFGPFLLLMGGFLLVEVWRGMRLRRMNWLIGLATTFAILTVLLLGVGTLVSAGVIDDSYRGLLANTITVNGGWDNINPQIIGRRIETLPTLLGLLSILVIVIARLFPAYRPGNTQPLTAQSGFTLLLIGAGVGLVLIPEFLYLRDNFSTRMNTVFKFYYQAWVLFSIASAYGVYSVVADVWERRPAWSLRMAYSIMLVLIVGAGMIYFPLAIYSRGYVENGAYELAGNQCADALIEGDCEDSSYVMTLDGGSRFVSQADYEAIQCLDRFVGDKQVVVAEAMPQGTNGTSVNYNPIHARVGSLTGIPVIMGWPGHQSQWRGTSYNEVVGTRPEDLNMLFTATNITLIKPVIERYSIDYIIYGATERLHYGSGGEQKFLDFYPVVCEAVTPYGTTRIYRVAQPTALSELIDGQ